MIRTITNWKGLSDVLRDGSMCPTIVRIAFREDGLESLSFASWNDVKEKENEHE